MPKRIPISAAKRFAAEQGCRQVVIAAWDGERTHVVTFGQTPEDCDQAAQGGDAIKRAMGWPEDANCKPSRLKAAEASRDALAAQVERLLAFAGKAGGTALGIAISGSRHPNPDQVLLDLSRESMELSASARALITPAAEKVDG